MTIRKLITKVIYATILKEKIKGEEVLIPIIPSDMPFLISVLSCIPHDD